MNEKCRLCLERFYSTNTTRITDGAFGAKLDTVFKFQIVSDEMLPEQVCQECLRKVTDFYSYTQTVHSNQKQLCILLKEKKMHPFEMVKIEAPDEDDYYDVEIDESNVCIETLTIKEEDPVQSEKHGAMNAEVDKDGCVDQEEPEDDEEFDDLEDNDDDEDYVPKVDPKDGFLKLPLKRNRKETERPRKSLKTPIEKLDSGEKQMEEDKRIQEFYKFDCEICSKSLGNLAHLQMHYRRAHGTKGYIRCCDRQLQRRFQLLDHIAAHEGTIKCTVCQKSYKSSRYLSLHMMKNHSREEDRPFKCDKCHQSFHKEHLLKAHLANHLSEKCPVCDKVVSSKYALKTHVTHMHGSDSNQICDMCGKEFRTKHAMERHINEHLGVDVVEKVQCHVCQRWFQGKYNLRKHIRFMHIEGGQIFRCDLCSHESPNSRALLDHKKRVHVVERFECELCGKRFKRKLYLREHIASHTGQPLYDCGICDAKFNSNANCYNHRKSKHPVEWKARRQAFLDAQRKAPVSEVKPTKT